MSIVKRNSVFFPSLINDFLKPDWFGGTENWNAGLPAVNIKDKTEGFELELAAPGLSKDDFKVEVDNDVLTISSELSTENTKEKDSYTRREFSYRSFKRAFSLPETVDGTKIDASYENGVLKLTLPKKEEALPKPKRLISIG